MDDFSPEDKYFMLYCLTNPHTNIIGCYEISMKQMAAELGYSVDSVMSLIKRFKEHHGVIDYDGETKELYVKNWHKYNWTESPKLNPSIVAALDTVKTHRFKQRIAELYNARDTVSIPYSYGMDTTDTDTVTDTVSDNSNKNEEKPKRRKKEIVRHQYGEYKNVLLSDEDIEKLQKEFPNKYLDYIERVSGYMKQHNKSYSDYLATIRNWIRRDMKKEQDAQKPPIYDPDSEGLKY